VETDERTQKKHFDFIALHELVALELVLDLIIPGFATLVLCAHATPHLDGSIFVLSYCDIDQVLGYFFGLVGR
jgi:hypothetical protein